MSLSPWQDGTTHGKNTNYKYMRTKALLCAAAVAAGAVSAMAQSNVYSLNIVGYVNLNATPGYSFTCAPLAAGVTNGLNEVLPPNTYDSGLGYGPFDGDQVLLWTGVSWRIIGLDSGSPTGFRDGSGAAIAAPVIAAGQGFLYNNVQGVAETLTYVGSVRTGTTTVNFPATPTMYAAGSAVPFSGGVTNVLQFSNVYDSAQGYGPLDGCQIEKAIITAGGQITGFSVISFDTGSKTGFRNTSGAEVAEPTINPAQGFFFNNVNGAVTPWTQVFNP